MDLVGQVGVKPERLEREIDPTRLPVVGIQIDHNQDKLGEIFCAFTIADDRIVIDGMKAQTPSVLKSTVFLADTVDPGDKILEAIGLSEIPMPDLILFRV